VGIRSRLAPLTSAHMAAVFVYEFEKSKKGDLRMLDRSNLSTIRHLRAIMKIDEPGLQHAPPCPARADGGRVRLS
jgi:hypothetical protein